MTGYRDINELCSQIFNSCLDVTTEIKNKVEQLCNPITHCTLLIPDPEQKKKKWTFLFVRRQNFKNYGPGLLPWIILTKVPFKQRDDVAIKNPYLHTHTDTNTRA